MNKVSRLKSFVDFGSSIQFTPTLIGSAILKKERCDRKPVSVFQARLEAKLFFDKIRDWNQKQVNPPLEALDPHVEELLPLMEMAIL